MTLRLTHRFQFYYKASFQNFIAQGIRKFHLKQNFPFTAPILLAKSRVKRKTHFARTPVAPFRDIYDHYQLRASVMTPPHFTFVEDNLPLDSRNALYDQTLLNSSPRTQQNIKVHIIDRKDNRTKLKEKEI